jgi:hypothetical protein
MLKSDPPPKLVDHVKRLMVRPALAELFSEPAGQQLFTVIPAAA